MSGPSRYDSRRFARPALRGAFALGLIMGAVAVAPRPATAQVGRAVASTDNGTITYVTDETPLDLDPASNSGSASALISRNIDDNLVAFDGASIDAIRPVLATSWSTNADKSVWTFHLRHGVSFHTGRCCMTADDVQYSLGRTVTAGLAASYLLGRFMTKPFSQIKVLDQYTVEFDLGHSQPIFLSALASYFTGPILDAQVLKAHVVKNDWGHNWATGHDLGAGPYVLQSWVHNQQAVLAQFPAYWGGWSGPHFSKVIIRTVPSSTTRRELIESGQADLTNDLTAQDNQALQGNTQVKVVSPPGTSIHYIAMTDAGLLASPYARQALSYTFNYDAYIKAAFHGYGRRAYGPLPSTLLGYDPHMFHYQTDLTKARALFQKAGISSGTTLTYIAGGGVGATPGLVETILQAQLAQLGITLKIQYVNASGYASIVFGSEPAAKRPNMLPVSWYPDYNDPYDEIQPLLEADQAPPGGTNLGLYHNAQVDALLKDMKYANRETLIRDAYQLQDITSRVDPPCIWLDEPTAVTVLAANLKGVLFNPLGIDLFNFYAMHH